MKIGLMGKILLGVAVLLVPLGITLWSVVQFGSTTIQVARAEAVGLEISRYSMNVAQFWQITGPSAPGDAKLLEPMDRYIELLAKHPELNLSEASLQAAGYTWMAPESIREVIAKGAGGDVALFAEVERRLLDQIAALSDASGLVLDPDLDSYYLMLALFDAMPKLLEETTALRLAVQPTKAKSAEAEQRIAAASVQIRQLMVRFSALVSRSIAADASSYGVVPGYGDKGPAALSVVEKIAQDVVSLANQRSASKVVNTEVVDARIDELIHRLDEFHDLSVDALDAMLQARIRSATASLVTAIGSAIVAIVIALTLLLAVLLNVSRRAKTLEGALKALASGDLTVDVTPKLLRSGDELGRLAVSVSSLRTSLRTQVQQIETTTQSLSQIGSNLGANSEQSAAAIEEMSATSSLVARFSTKQMELTSQADDSVQSILAKVQQANDLTANMAAHFFMFGQSMEANRKRIMDTATEAQRSGELAVTLAETGESGAKSLETLNQAIAAVVTRTSEIQEVVQIILDIADRSALLSMNAAIEAAHAGTSGRGFAVVAEEIRKMAETSSKQAQTIGQLLSGISEAAQQTRDRSQATAESFRQLNHDILKVAEAGRSIATQMEHQEQEDGKLSEGLVQFTDFYAQLAESMNQQVTESQQVKASLGTLQDSSREISGSMAEQKLGMEQATEAVIQVRETALQVSMIIEALREEVARFKL